MSAELRVIVLPIQLNLRCASLSHPRTSIALFVVLKTMVTMSNVPYFKNIDSESVFNKSYAAEQA